MFLKYDFESVCRTSFDEFIKVYEEINHELWHLYSINKTTKEELRYQRFHKAFQYFKYDDVDFAKHWSEEYIQISPYKTHLVDGTIDILNYLKPNYKLHIITNGFKEVQHIKLDCCKLKPYFDQVIISEEHGFNKPDIQIFELAQNLTNSVHTECVMIGDNYDTDILGSLNANWQSIHLANKKVDNESVNFYHIQNLVELKHLL